MGKQVTDLTSNHLFLLCSASEGFIIVYPQIISNGGPVVRLPLVVGVLALLVPLCNISYSCAGLNNDMWESVAPSMTKMMPSSRLRTFTKPDSLSQCAIRCNKRPIHNYKLVTRLPTAAACVDVPPYPSFCLFFSPVPGAHLL